MTVCTNCKEEKGDDFKKRSKVCKDCDRIKDKINTDPAKTITCSKCQKTTSDFRNCRKKCNDCERARGREYRKTTDTAKVWAENNKDKLVKARNEYLRNKYHNNQKFKIKSYHVVQINSLFRNEKSKYSKHVKCSRERLLNWIQYQFTDGMTLENHTTFWVFDHVLPVKLYLDGKSNAEVILTWMNVKPVLKEYNSKKNITVDKQQCANHLENLNNYFNTRKLDVNKEYIQELEKYINL